MKNLLWQKGIVFLLMMCMGASAVTAQSEGTKFGIAGTTGEVSSSSPPVLDIIPEDVAVSGYAWNTFPADNPYQKIRSCLAYRERVEGRLNDTIFGEQYTYGRNHLCYDSFTERLAILKDAEACPGDEPCLDTDGDAAESRFKQVVQANPEIVWLVGSKPEAMSHGALVDEITVRDVDGNESSLFPGGAAAYADFYAYIYQLVADGLNEISSTEAPRLAFCSTQIGGLDPDAPLFGLEYCQEAYSMLQDALFARNLQVTAVESIHALATSQFLFRESAYSKTIMINGVEETFTGGELLDAAVLQTAMNDHWIEYLLAFECWTGTVESCDAIGLDHDMIAPELTDTPLWLTAFGAVDAWCHEVHDEESPLQSGGIYCDETGEGHTFFGRHQNEGMWGMMRYQVEYLARSSEWERAWWFVSHSGEVEDETTLCTASGTLWYFEDASGNARCSGAAYFNGEEGWTAITTPLGVHYGNVIDCEVNGDESCDAAAPDNYEPLNDQCEQATRLELDASPQLHNLNGVEADENGDWFVIDLPSGNYEAVVGRVDDITVSMELAGECSRNNAAFVPSIPIPVLHNDLRTIQVPSIEDEMTVRIFVEAQNETDSTDSQYTITVQSTGWQTAQDTDGDGIPDQVELNGLDIDGDRRVDVDLPAMGADPFHKDVFVEIDYMRGRPNSRISTYQPPQDAIDIVVEAFANAPVDNPNGETGIRLHVDYGEDAPLTWSDDEDAVWGELSRANHLLHRRHLLECNNDSTQEWSHLDSMKENHFELARATVFHYNIWGDSLCDHPDAKWVLGLSRNDEEDNFGQGASDFLVFWEWWLDRGNEPSSEELAGLFMHELGHNLGLKHGGMDHLNFKPNYFSVMNYSFTLPGLNRDGSWENYDYSRYSNPPLNEDILDENVGLNYDNWGIGATLYYCTNNDFEPWQGIAGGEIDWNCDGEIEDDVRASINVDGTDRLLTSVEHDVLETQNDWDRLIYRGGSVGGFAVHPDQGIIPLTTLLPGRTAIDEERPVDSENILPLPVTEWMLFLPMAVR